MGAVEANAPTVPEESPIDTLNLHPLFLKESRILAN